MRPGQQNNNSNNNKNRQRGRNNNNGGRKHMNPLSRNYESNGPDVKVRGNAAHIAEKYVQLARDAHASGDSVMAENYLQHAEHYYRIVSAAQPQGMPRSDQVGQENEGEGDDEDFGADEQSRFDTPQFRASLQAERPYQDQQRNDQPQQQRDDRQPRYDQQRNDQQQPRVESRAGERVRRSGRGTGARRGCVRGCGAAGRRRAAPRAGAPAAPASSAGWRGRCRRSGWSAARRWGTTGVHHRRRGEQRGGIAALVRADATENEKGRALRLAFSFARALPIFRGRRGIGICRDGGCP